MSPRAAAKCMPVRPYRSAWFTPALPCSSIAMTPCVDPEAHNLPCRTGLTPHSAPPASVCLPKQTPASGLVIPAARSGRMVGRLPQQAAAIERGRAHSLVHRENGNELALTQSLAAWPKRGLPAWESSVRAPARRDWRPSYWPSAAGPQDGTRSGATRQREGAGCTHKGPLAHRCSRRGRRPRRTARSPFRQCGTKESSTNMPLGILNRIPRNPSVFTV